MPELILLTCPANEGSWLESQDDHRDFRHQADMHGVGTVKGTRLGR